MWARLHGSSEDGETPVTVQADVTSEKAREEAEAAKKTNPPMTSTRPGGQKQPSQVSNNNSDAEGPPDPPPKGESGVLNITLSLKKRKITLDEASKEGSDEEDAEKATSNKKLRTSSPVAI